MNLVELSKLLHNGNYLYDFSLQEYEFLRYFINQVKPNAIEVIGGNANLDLFYACQDIKLDIVNHDPGDTDDSGLYQKQQYLKKLLNFKGDYTWLQRSVSTYNQLFYPGNTIMINANQDITYQLIDNDCLPKNVIFCHYGNIYFSENILSLAEHRQLICCGKRLAFFSDKKLDLGNTKFNFSTHRNFFNISPLTILSK